MRSFVSFILYFTGDQQFGEFASRVGKDAHLPQADCPHALRDYLIQSEQYQDLHEHIDALYNRYLKHQRVGNKK